MNSELRTKKSWILANLANAITLSGVALCCVLTWVVVFHPQCLCVIFVFGALILLSDAVDGPVAQYNKCVSRFGAAADRLRDKQFEFTMFWFFIVNTNISPWLKAAICLPAVFEIFLLGIWFLGVVCKMDVSAGPWGKRKMVLVSAGIMACQIVLIIWQNQAGIPAIATAGLSAVFLVSGFLALLSLRDHVVQYCRQLQPQQ